MLQLFIISVQKASLRFVELETVSQHQRCMLTDCYQVIDMLKAELAEQQLIEPATGEHNFFHIC